MSSLTREQIERIKKNGLYSWEQKNALCDMALRALPAGEAVAPVARAVSEVSVPMQDVLNEPCKGCGKKPLDFIFGASTAPVAAEPVAIEVRVGCLTESNGRKTWIVGLVRPQDTTPFDHLQVYSSEIKGRAEFEAAKFRYFFGQGPEPDLLAYDTAESNVDSHSSKGEKP